MVKIGATPKFDPMKSMDIYSPKGTKVRFKNRGGYPYQLSKAAEELDMDTTYVVDRIEVHSFESTVYFEQNPNRGYNTVMFAEV